MSDEVKKAVESLLGVDAPVPTPMPDDEQQKAEMAERAVKMIESPGYDDIQWWDIDEWLARHPHKNLPPKT